MKGLEELIRFGLKKNTIIVNNSEERDEIIKENLYYKKDMWIYKASFISSIIFLLIWIVKAYLIGWYSTPSTIVTTLVMCVVVLSADAYLIYKNDKFKKGLVWIKAPIALTLIEIACLIIILASSTQSQEGMLARTFFIMMLVSVIAISFARDERADDHHKDYKALGIELNGVKYEGEFINSELIDLEDFLTSKRPINIITVDEFLMHLKIEVSSLFENEPENLSLIDNMDTCNNNLLIEGLLVLQKDINNNAGDVKIKNQMTKFLHGLNNERHHLV